MEEATFPRLLISSSRIILGGEKFWDVGSPRGFSGKSKMVITMTMATAMATGKAINNAGGPGLTIFVSFVFFAVQREWKSWSAAGCAVAAG